MLSRAIGLITLHVLFWAANIHLYSKYRVNHGEASHMWGSMVMALMEVANGPHPQGVQHLEPMEV